MDGLDQLDDEHVFKVAFATDGVIRLRDRVKEKLKEFMGDYTDDTLVEYVIVLLRNGRCKGEARNELNVFLGDDSESFVSWLWHHLASDMKLYALPEQSYPDEVSKNKPALGTQGKRSDPQHLHSESNKETSAKLSRRRRNKEWKGLMRDETELPPLRSSEIDQMNTEEDNHHSARWSKRALSPRRPIEKKSNYPDERRQAKKEDGSEATVAVSRRLLQFAVRDAVGTSRPTILPKDPKLKRLRSVVSTSMKDSSDEDCPLKMQSVARMSSAAAVAIKAVAEAAEDVVKYRYTGNVFDRISGGVDVSDIVAEDGDDVEYERDHDQLLKKTRTSFIQEGNYGRGYARDATMLGSETGLASSFVSDREGYDDAYISQTGTYGGSRILEKAWDKDQDQPVSVANASRKMEDISVNENTWKPPHYQTQRGVAVVNNLQSVHEGDLVVGKFGGHLKKENSNPVTNGHRKPAAGSQNESQKVFPPITGSYSNVLPIDDVDSRTIFVNNVHFAATKDNLSRHFNTFGEILKVVIVTDPTTGQPKGCACVEFMRKEAAEQALSLDGTSFMSRILKVVRRSAALPEAAPAMTWPRARGSAFSAAKFSRSPFPRGIPGAFRSRLSVKSGARSMQWKREAQTTPSESGTSNSVPSSTGRGLTYVRTEPKAADAVLATS